MTLVSLGCGQGDKEALLLRSLMKSGREVSYLAVDASRWLLAIALKKATRFLRADKCRGWAADMTKKGFLRKLKRRTRRPRLLTLLGNTLGGFDPLRMVKLLRRILHKGDFLLVDGEIYAGKKTLQGYDHPINRAFAWAPLKALGITEDDGELRLDLKKDRRRKGLYFVEKYFRTKKGKILPMSPSYKYSKNCFHHLIQKEAHLKICEEWESRDRRFILLLTCPGHDSIRSKSPRTVWR